MTPLLVTLCSLTVGQFDGLGSDLIGSPMTDDSSLEIREANIRPIDRAELSTSATGLIISDVPVEGTQLNKGDLVAELDDEIPKAALRRAEIQASSDIDEELARAYYDVARNEYAQQLAANEKVPDTITQLEVERSKLTAKRSYLDILKARHEQDVAVAASDEARAQLGSYFVKAPFDGVVTQRLKQHGEAVRPGDPIIELVNLNRVHVQAPFPVEALRRVPVGTEVSVYEDYGGAFAQPNDPLKGRVVLISPKGNTVDGTVEVLIEVENTNQRLIPGLFARVSVK